MDKYHPVALHFSAISFYQRRVSWKQKLSLAEDWVSNGVHGMFGICFWHEQVRWGIKNKKKQTKKQKRWWIDCELWYEPARGKPTHTRVTCFLFLFFFGVIDVYSTWKSHHRNVFLFFFLSPCFSFTYFKCCALRKKKNMLLLTTW